MVLQSTNLVKYGLFLFFQAPARHRNLVTNSLLEYSFPFKCP